MSLAQLHQKGKRASPETANYKRTVFELETLTISAI